jgi:aconitate hydratase
LPQGKKSPVSTLVALARFGEIIYIAGNTPAVGVNFIQAPNME